MKTFSNDKSGKLTKRPWQETLTSWQDVSFLSQNSFYSSIFTGWLCWWKEGGVCYPVLDRFFKTRDAEPDNKKLRETGQESISSELSATNKFQLPRIPSWNSSSSPKIQRDPCPSRPNRPPRPHIRDPRPPPQSVAGTGKTGRRSPPLSPPSGSRTRIECLQCIQLQILREKKSILNATWAADQNFASLTKRPGVCFCHYFTPRSCRTNQKISNYTTETDGFPAS